MTWNESYFKGMSYRFLYTLAASLLATSPIYCEQFSAQQAVLLKRITEYWKEGDIEVAKSQITSYLNKFPDSKATDSLYAMLGDLLLKEQKFELALEQYKKIQDQDIQDRVGFNKAICLYEQKHNDELILLVTKTLAYPVQIKESETLKFFLAESFLRKALATDNKEDKNHLLAESLSHYKGLLETKYAEQSISPAAEIAEILGYYEDASSFYQLVLQKNPHDTENILYKLAVLQEKIKPISAIDLFGKVYRLRGEKASNAAVRQLQILFQADRFEELLIKQEQALPHINEESAPLAHYWIGQSLLHLGDFAQAKPHLLWTLIKKDLLLSDQKILINSLITCAQATRDVSLMQEMIQRIEAVDQKDPDLANAYLLEYQMLIHTNPTLAATTLNKLIVNFPNHKDRESILFNLGLIQYDLKQWAESSATLSILLNEFPSSKLEYTAIRMQINGLVEELKVASPDTAIIKKTALSSLLEKVLKKGKALNKEEKTKYHFVYCQMLVQINQIEEALVQLGDYIDNNPDALNLGVAYMMMANLYERSENEHLLFISSAEKALLTGQELEERGSIHLRLYNKYLKLSENPDNKETEYLICQAANHLYQGYLNGSPVNNKNLSWLSDYFFQQAKQEPSSQNLEKGITLFEHILKIQKYPPNPKIENKNLLFEIEKIKLAELLNLQGKISQQVDLLEVLVYQQKNNPTLKWKYQRRSLLDLARAYVRFEQIEDAIDTYSHLIESSALSTSYIGNIAVIEKSKLRYDQLSKNRIEEDNEELLSLLDDLKDLEIKKKLCSEPTHLEAGLTYIYCKTSHLHLDKKREKTLHLLEILRENFSSDQNPSVQEYLRTSYIYPEKAKIHESYMKFIDASICKQKAEIALEQKNKHEAHRLIKQATLALRELMANELLPSDLLTRVRSDMESMENTL